jgi:hypothetical protein
LDAITVVESLNLSSQASHFFYFFSGLKCPFTKRLQILPVISATFLLLQGCGKLAFPEKTGAVTMLHASALDGIYQNRSIDTKVPNNTLWAVIVRKAGEPGFKPDFSQNNLSVKLQAAGKKRIIAQLYEESRLIDQRELKGRIEDSTAFRLRQRNHNRGVPFFYMKLTSYGYRLRKDDKGRLVVDVVDSKGKMIFILSGGETDHYSFSYLRE